jgi:hypothetical protein
MLGEPLSPPQKNFFLEDLSLGARPEEMGDRPEYRRPGKSGTSGFTGGYSADSCRLEYLG